jgi:hypothetical protein
MVQSADPDFSVSVYNTLRSHVKPLADVYQHLPEHQEKSYCPLMVDRAKKRPTFSGGDYAHGRIHLIRGVENP